MNELKNLQCIGLTTLGAALKHALDVLNINRMQTGIDTYGQGRCPFYLEPSVIVVITDGGKYTTNQGVNQDVRFLSVYLSIYFFYNIFAFYHVKKTIKTQKKMMVVVHIADALSYTWI